MQHPEYTPGLPVRTLVRGIALVLVLGLAGVLLAVVSSIGSVLLLLASLAVGISLLRADGTNQWRGADYMHELYFELETRVAVNGERLDFCRATPERSLTRRF